MKLTPKKAGKASRRVMAAALVALSLPALTGCIDDKYDLSDVDTTVRVNVDNLTVPVNIDAVTLRCIFDLKSDSKVKEVDGAYAYVDNGDLHSSGIRVSPIHLPAPYVAPTTATVNIPDNPFGSSRKGRRYASSLKVDFTGPGTTFTAEADNVSTSISGIERVGGSISGVNLGVGTFGASFGWVANLHLTGFNFFLGMDRVPGKLCKQGVPLSSNAQVTMGINFPF